MDEIIGRIQEAEGVTTLTDVATALDMSRENLTQYKGRGKVPYSNIAEYCARTGQSLDYIIYGHQADHCVNETVATYGADDSTAYTIAARMHSLLAASGTTLSEENFTRILRMVHREMQQHDLIAIPPGKLEDMLPLAAVPLPDIFNAELFARVWVAVNQALDSQDINPDPVGRAEVAFKFYQKYRLTNADPAQAAIVNDIKTA